MAGEQDAGGGCTVADEQELDRTEAPVRPISAVVERRRHAGDVAELSAAGRQRYTRLLERLGS